MSGILAGCDANLEWLLPWWWEHLQKENSSFPVAFADFGMSEKAKAWCREKGALFEVPIPHLSLLAEKTRLHWETRWNMSSEKMEKLRPIWFQKPLAFAMSPFEKTLWLDLDCEVRASLDPLFDLPLPPSGFALCPVEQNLYGFGEFSSSLHYNTGVTLFTPSSPLLALWIREIPVASAYFFSEEELLDFLIAYLKMPVSHLPEEENWEVLRLGENKKARIYHWMGQKGKAVIAASLQNLSHRSGAPLAIDT